MASVYLLLSNDYLHCYKKQRGKIKLIKKLGNRYTEKQFEDVLHEIKVFTVHLITDISDEEYLIEATKESSFFERRENQNLTLYKTFPGTRYRFLSKIPQVVLSSSKRESYVLCAGIRDSMVLDRTLRNLAQCKVPVASIYSLSMLLHKMVDINSNNASPFKFLVCGESTRQWRYLLFKGQTLLINRCIASHSNDAWVDIYNEVRGTLTHAKLNKYLPADVRPDFFYAGPILPMTVMGMHVHKKLALRYSLNKSPSVSLYEHCMQQFSPLKANRFRFDQPELMSVYNKLRAAHATLVLTALLFFGSLFVLMDYLNDSASTTGFSVTLERENDRVRDNIDYLKVQTSQYPHHADEVFTMVNAFSELDAEANLRVLIFALANALTTESDIQLESLRWTRLGQTNKHSDMSRYSRRQSVDEKESAQLTAELSIRPGLGTIGQQQKKADFLAWFSKDEVRITHTDVQRANDQYRAGKLGEAIDASAAYRFEIVLESLVSESS